MSRANAHMIRAASRSDLFVSDPSRHLDFLICEMCSSAIFLVEGMSIMQCSVASKGDMPDVESVR